MVKEKKRFKNVWKYLQAGVRRNGACHLVLLDPDKESSRMLAERAKGCQAAGVDGLLVGGSSIRGGNFSASVKAIYHAVSIPVILFPGKASQVTKHADAILFTSLVSGRNPEFLIGQQVKGAPLVKKFGLEVIPTGYILVASGSSTAVQRVSKTRPLPRGNNTLVAQHALAANYFGMQAVYLEAGSGAKHAVPDSMIKKVKQETSITIIAGGGIRSPAQAFGKVRAGADIIVTGTVFEKNFDAELLKNMTHAIKNKGKKT